MGSEVQEGRGCKGVDAWGAQERTPYAREVFKIFLEVMKSLQIFDNFNRKFAIFLKNVFSKIFSDFSRKFGQKFPNIKYMDL